MFRLGITMGDASESESDDDGQANTFVTLGQSAIKRATYTKG